MILLWFIKWRLASALKIEKYRHTDAKNSKLGGKNKEPFLLVGGDQEKWELGIGVLIGGSQKEDANRT